jgi:hypothetical protein
MSACITRSRVGSQSAFLEITFVLQCWTSFLGPVHLLGERVEADWPWAIFCYFRLQSSHEECNVPYVADHFVVSNCYYKYLVLGLLSSKSLKHRCESDPLLGYHSLSISATGSPCPAISLTLLTLTDFFPDPPYALIRTNSNLKKLFNMQ